MRLKYAKLIGLVGVCRASGLKEIYIDFTKSIHKIILIIGKNGSGKSTIEDALTPFPEQASKYYLSGEAGYKEIAYTMEDGTEYICKIEYPVNKLGERLQTKAYLEKIVDGVSVELNPNGNIGSYKDVLYSEFYLDANYREKITLDDLAARFFINKYYLLKLFKDRYGVTVNTYLNQVRITYVKQQLRFTDKTMETLAAELHIEPAYLSRLFKKIEGISPTQFRKSWRGQ